MSSDYQGGRVIAPEDVGAITLAGANHVVGVGPTLITPPSDRKTLWVQVDSGTFRVRAGDYVPRTITSVAGATDIITMAAHGFSSGDGPYKMIAATTLDTGLVATDLFYIRVLSASTFTLHTSKKGALNDNETDDDIIDLAADGVGAEVIASHIDGAGEGVGWANALVPVAIADGYGSMLIGSGLTVAFSAPEQFTVRGFAAGDTLTWWAV